MSGAGAVPANHLVFEGDGVSGLLDTSSIRGTPTAAVSVDGTVAGEVRVERDGVGWRVTGIVAVGPELPRRFITVLVPEVQVGDAPEAFVGVAILATAPAASAGPARVTGPLTQYGVRQLAGSASAVAF